MTRGELIALLAELGVRPSRSLGQNFLVDANLLDWLVRTTAPAPGERILEIGPGTGVLTARLLAAGARVTAVELDHRLAGYLRQHFAGEPGLALVEADACQVDYPALLGDGPFRCIANLPYAVSTVVLMRLLELASPPRECFVLLQEEMAERLRAGPASKEYGALSVLAQLQCSVERVRRVSPQVFFPPPEVGSAFVRLRHRGADALPAAARPALRELLRLGFGQRRKQLRGQLTPRFAAAAVDQAFARLGLAADVRAEALAPAVLLRLSEQLAGRAVDGSAA
jgi:16S rRNA (adenine1518-N6/adenine1519-N6)-dimethyltransferase